MNREYMVSKLLENGYKYQFNKYSDKQIYMMYDRIINHSNSSFSIADRKCELFLMELKNIIIRLFKLYNFNDYELVYSKILNSHKSKIKLIYNKTLYCFYVDFDKNVYILNCVIDDCFKYRLSIKNFDLDEYKINKWVGDIIEAARNY